MKNSNSANDILRGNFQCKLQTDINLLHSLTKHATNKMERRFKQLSLIANDHFDALIRMESEAHLVNQSKLMFIGYELLAKIKTSTFNLENNIQIDEGLVKQYAVELDLLNLMDFKVTKSYFLFINNHYKGRTISMNQRAA